MRWLILVLMVCSTAFADGSDPLGTGDFELQAGGTDYQTGKILPRRAAYDLKDQIEQGELAARTDAAIAEIIRVAVIRLRTEGFSDEAWWTERIYDLEYKGFLTRMVSGRDIGDHKPLIEWLANTLKMLEDKLGFETCKALRLTDIDVLNYGIPIVFRPCSFDMNAVQGDRIDEYRRHFAASPKYGGALVPVVTFWTVDISCSVITYGAGWFFICAPLGNAAEWIMQKWIAPKLSDRIFHAACGG